MKVQIKMKKGNPSKWIKISEEERNNEYIVWLVSEENASTIEIFSLEKLKNIGKAFNDNDIDLIKVVEEK